MSKRRLTAKQREVKALELRLAGGTYDQIAEAMGISRTGAYKAVARALDRLNQQSLEDAERLRRLELERLERATLAIAQRVKEGHLRSIDRWIRLSESRRKLLGLDASTQANVTLDSEVKINLTWSDDGIDNPAKDSAQ